MTLMSMMMVIMNHDDDDEEEEDDDDDDDDDDNSDDDDGDDDDDNDDDDPFIFCKLIPVFGIYCIHNITIQQLELYNIFIDKKDFKGKLAGGNTHSHCK